MDSWASIGSAIALAAVFLGCGAKSPLDLAEASGGAGGGSTTSSTGATTGTGSTGGTGGTMLTCTTPNPAGCVQTGCSPGSFCDLQSPECVSSSCTCEPASGTWACDDDCGGGVCVGLSATYYARFGYLQGQESTGEFCVAYTYDIEGQPIFEPEGLLAANGLVPGDIEGMDKLSRYLPLAAPPVALGKAYGDCSGFVKSVFLPLGATHYTMISVPFSGEPDHLWAVVDPGVGPVTPGLRVVNAIRESAPLSATADGVPLGQLEWANSPQGYADIGAESGFDHLAELWIQNGAYGIDSTLSWVGWDLIPMQALTIYVSGQNPGFTGLGCFDAKPDTGGKLSNCWLVNASP